MVAVELGSIGVNGVTPLAGVETMPTKPSKPSPDFPLYAHGAGRWAKKIDGKTVYFGRWDDPNAALAAYNAMLLSRKEKRHDVVSQTGLTVRIACDSFLTAKED